MIENNQNQHFPNELFRFFEPQPEKHKAPQRGCVNKLLSHNIWKWWDNII